MYKTAREKFFDFLKKSSETEVVVSDFNNLKGCLLDINKWIHATRLAWDGEFTQPDGIPVKFFNVINIEGKYVVFVNPRLDLALVNELYPERVPDSVFFENQQILGDTPTVFSSADYKITTIRTRCSSLGKGKYGVYTIGSGDIIVCQKDQSNEAGATMQSLVADCTESGQCEIPSHISEMSLRSYVSAKKLPMKIKDRQLIRSDVYYFQKIHELNGLIKPEKIENAGVKYGWFQG